MWFNFSAFTLFLILSVNLGAQENHAPPSFSIDGKKAIFVDFQEAVYDLVYDLSEKKVKSTATIYFESSEEGMPIFDLVENPDTVFLNGKQISDKLISSPDGETKLRIAEASILPGKHTIKIESTISREVEFSADSVYSAFWFSDFKDRSFLEAYLPSNLEYDQYKITFNIDFKNLKNQKIYSNGKVSQITDSSFKVQFPTTFTASSVYFHTDKIGKNSEMPFVFHSINKRKIPVMLYSLDPKSDLKINRERITEILNNLEKKYGAFIHPTLTILDSGQKEMAMEYCGALTFDPWTLQHELTHSYFARGGFMPANGNAGWIDEAITYWNDKGSPIVKDLGNMKTNLSGHSAYRRFTDHQAPSEGSKFMSYLHYKFIHKGGLNPFLNHLIRNNAWKPMTTNEFKDKISKFYAEDLTELFNKHLYIEIYKF